MIIVPAEKQFTWRYTPLVLFSLVLLNILIYFFYQSNDQSKLAQAFSRYQGHEYFEREWPIYSNYLQAQNETQMLEVFRQNYRDEEFEPIIQNLLMDEGFYAYLQINARNFFYEDFYDQWIIERRAINRLIQSTSALSYGFKPDDWHLFSLISYQFMHGSLMHLLGNMFFLIVCGFAVEAAIGHWRFLLFYLVSGVVSCFVHMLANPDNSAPLIGASGSISGVMAMYLAVFRMRRIEFFYWFFFFVGYFRAPALLILPIYIGKEVYSFLTEPDANVAFMGHVGGFLGGALCIGIAYALNKSVLNTEYIDRDELVAPRQQALADIYAAIERFRFERAFELVDAQIARDGIDFQLAQLRYNLLRIDKGEAFVKAAQALLKLPVTDHIQVKKLDKIWRDNPEARAYLSEQQALKLGMQFTELDNPASAEQLFEQLAVQNCKNPAMAAFAEKLAAAFLRARNIAKQTHYSGLAKQYGLAALNRHE